MRDLLQKRRKMKLERWNWESKKCRAAGLDRDTTRFQGHPLSIELAVGFLSSGPLVVCLLTAAIGGTPGRRPQ